MTADDRPTLDDVLHAMPGPSEAWGRLDGVVGEIVVCWAASLSLVAEHADAGTVLICRAHPLSVSPTGFHPSEVHRGETWTEALGEDGVLRAKHRALRHGAPAVVWAPALWDSIPDLADELPARAGLSPTVRIGRAAVAEVEPQRMADLLDRVLRAWSAPRALITGDADQVVRRVGFLPGIASPSELALLLEDVDAAVVGETVEWEGTPFLQDVRSEGHPVVLAAAGTMITEQVMNRAVASVLSERWPGVRAHAAELDDAAWTVAEVERWNG